MYGRMEDNIHLLPRVLDHQHWWFLHLIRLLENGVHLLLLLLAQNSLIFSPFENHIPSSVDFCLTQFWSAFIENTFLDCVTSLDKFLLQQYKQFFWQLNTEDICFFRLITVWCWGVMSLYFSPCPMWTTTLALHGFWKCLSIAWWMIYTCVHFLFVFQKCENFPPMDWILVPCSRPN